jgi:hypothetical protein
LEASQDFYFGSGSRTPDLYSVSAEKQDMKEVCEELATFLSLHIEYLSLHRPYRKGNSSSVVECVTVAVRITVATSGFQFYWGGGGGGRHQGQQIYLKK